MMEVLGRQPFTTSLLSNGTFSEACCRDVLKADRVEINIGAPDREGIRKFTGWIF